MTDNTIPLPDAIRAFKDRPSMEKELQELRERNQELTDKLRGDMVWIEDLRAKCERLEGERQKLRKQNALMATALKWKDEEVHPQTVIHNEFRAMLAEQERDALRTKCERYEAALIVMGGLVRAAIDGNAATRQDVILQIGRMISQALNEEGDK